MPRELRPLRKRHGLAGAGPGPGHTLSARGPAAAQTLASAATQGRCGMEERQVAALGLVVGKGCLKRQGTAADVRGSGAAKKVSFLSEPQVRLISPPAVVRASGRQRGGETLPAAEVGPGRVRFGGGSSESAGASAPLRRSMRNAANLGVGVQQGTLSACHHPAKSEGEGDVRETVVRKRKNGEDSEHTVVSAQIGVPPRSTSSSCVLSEAPFELPPVVEKKRARSSKGPDVGELTLEEQPAKLKNRGQPAKPATRSNSYQELASSAEEGCQEQVVALCKVPPLRRSGRNHSKGSRLLLNGDTSSGSHNCTGAWKDGSEVKHNATKDNTEEGMAKQDEDLELSWNTGAKDCAGTEEQMVQVVARKGCLKRSGADVSSGSSGVAKRVTFKLVEQAGAEVRRPQVIADGGGDAGEAGSTAPLMWSRRNPVNFGAGDGVERIAGAVSRNISAKADEEEEDAGDADDRKRKASGSVEDIGYVWLLPNIATTNLSQIVAATKSAANKMATKVVANFGKRLSLYHADQGANKAGQAAVVTVDHVDA